MGHGIVNEVDGPVDDRPQVRDLGFIVADDAGAWYEVKRLVERMVRSVEAGVPAVVSEFRHSRFTLTLRICSAAHRDVQLIEARLRSNDSTPMRPYPILAPHWARWHGVPPVTRRRTWRLATPITTFPVGHTLRIELLRPALVHDSLDDWASTHDLDARDSGVGLWMVDIDPGLAQGASIIFAIQWAADRSWEPRDFRVSLAAAAAVPGS